MRMLLFLIALSLTACGAKKVHKEKALDQIRETQIHAKANQAQLNASLDALDKLHLFTADFQADSIVVTKDATTYYNPSNKKEKITREKTSNRHRDFSNLKLEILDLKKQIFKGTAAKATERKQVDYFKAIGQFWPMLLLLVVAYLIWNRKKK